MKQLTTWNDKQKQYVQDNAESFLTIHLLLDRSPSMRKHQYKLIESVDFYLNELSDDLSFMTDIRITNFDDECKFMGNFVPYDLPNINDVYAARRGHYTAIVDALYGYITTVPEELKAGQNMLIVFTDGEDTRSQVEAHQLRSALETLQTLEDWLCVFMGAHRDAIAQGVSYGFPIDNCLVFPSKDIPKAFESLLKASRRYLAARAEAGGKRLGSKQFFLQEKNP